MDWQQNKNTLTLEKKKHANRKAALIELEDMQLLVERKTFMPSFLHL